MNKIWNYIKEGQWLKSISFWAFVVLIALYIWLWKSCNKPQEIIDLGYKPVEKYVDKDGEEHSTIKIQEVTPETMKRIVDSIAKNTKGKVQYITQVVTETDTIFRDIPVIIDSTKYEFKVSKKDNYLTLDITGNWKTKKADVIFQQKDTLTHAITKTTRFLKSNELKVDLSNKSPYNDYVEGRSFILKEKKPLITFGVVGGYGISTQGELRGFVGLGASLPIITIKTH